MKPENQLFIGACICLALYLFIMYGLLCIGAGLI